MASITSLFNEREAPIRANMTVNKIGRVRGENGFPTFKKEKKKRRNPFSTLD